MSPPTSKYRPDIDGLRAIAVLAVIAYHAFPTLLGGGFAGVDVFFVISGFLISSILFEQIRSQQFNIIGFYRRRISRIFPALLIVLAVSFGCAYVSLFPDEFIEFINEFVNGTKFTANFYLWRSFGYFDQSASLKPLLHLWSLAIEEQFYIVWPILLWVLHKAKLGWGAALGAITLLSFGTNLYLTHTNPIADYYSPLARAWELALGSLIAWIAATSQWTPSNRVGDAIGVAGIVGLFASFCLIRSDGYPGIAALLPTCSTAFVIYAGKNSWGNRNILSVRPLVSIGLISYALYLWHWPLLTFARILEGDVPALRMRLFALAIALVLSWMTYRFVERPMRFGRYLPAKACFAIACMAGLWFVGRSALHTEVYARGIEARNPLYSSSSYWPTYPKANNACALAPADRALLLDCFYDPREEPRFALIGDSKATMLSQGIIDQSKPGGRWAFWGGICKAGQDICSSTITLSPEHFPKEYVQSRMILNAIESHPKIRTVVIANAMRKLFAFPNDSSMDFPVSPQQESVAIAALDSAISELVQHDRTVYLLIDNPTLRGTEDCIGRITTIPAINAVMGLPHIPTSCSLTYANYRHLSERYRLLLQQVADRHKGSVHVIETSDIYCDIQANICPIARDHTRLYGLSDHASYYSASRIGARVNQLLDLPEHDRRLASTR